MKRSIFESILRGGVFFVGIFSAVLASPALDASGSQPDRSQKVLFDVQGMKNSLDAEKIQKGLKGRLGILSTECDHVGGKCKVEIDPTKVRKEDVAVEVNKMGFQAFLAQ
ncbi:MAG TPA: hypothetical protein VLJ37_09745 [bacterium]|nr:hypothetical protein [bacterium]